MDIIKDMEDGPARQELLMKLHIQIIQAELEKEKEKEKTKQIQAELELEKVKEKEKTKQIQAELEKEKEKTKQIQIQADKENENKNNQGMLIEINIITYILTTTRERLLGNSIKYYGFYFFFCSIILAFESETVLSFLFKLLKMTFSTMFNSVYAQVFFGKPVKPKQRSNKKTLVVASDSDKRVDYEEINSLLPHDNVMNDKSVTFYIVICYNLCVINYVLLTSTSSTSLLGLAFYTTNNVYY